MSIIKSERGWGGVCSIRLDGPRKRLRSRDESNSSEAGVGSARSGGRGSVAARSFEKLREASRSCEKLREAARSCGKPVAHIPENLAHARRDLSAPPSHLLGCAWPRADPGGGDGMTRIFAPRTGRVGRGAGGADQPRAPRPRTKSAPRAPRPRAPPASPGRHDARVELCNHSECLISYFQHLQHRPQQKAHCHWTLIESTLLLEMARDSFNKIYSIIVERAGRFVFGYIYSLLRENV